jgi:hypothetical protein
MRHSTFDTHRDKLIQRRSARYTRKPPHVIMRPMLELPLPPPRRFPFDRIGVTALICAGVFAGLAAILSLMLI